MAILDGLMALKLSQFEKFYGLKILQIGEFYDPNVLWPDLSILVP